MDDLKESLRDLDAALDSLFAFGARKQSDAQTVAELNATGIRCTCGRIFEGRPWQAKTNQPAPELWSAMQQFKAHIKSLAVRDDASEEDDHEQHEQFRDDEAYEHYRG